MEKVDARVQKTKKRLCDALISLMQEKRLEHITVKELCARSGLNRGTFYLHYQNVFELMQDVEQGLEEGFSQVLLRAPIETLYAGGQKPVLDDVCRYFEEHAAACRLFLSRGEHTALVERVKRVVRERALAQWRLMYGEDPRYEYAFAFVASGCIGMLTLWLEQDTPCSAEEMAQMMEGFIAKAAEAMAPQSDPKTR
ncbi:MAG TPA: TetR/AcrR family transcriptional regulator [Candidatus Ruthenibacterium avium]|uniref:TetR/AcrR family transcriptional regulator n=1 Tax=Candidatus Ruthenibacterium avium TaxID=2838751 RepID=A0A9D2S215_9FIRM|nr:TetR/AcrR family transcriptional regulator [Candidatus Ruthenibacterium avium]